MEKVSIPIKTRIAICWIIVSSGLLLCYGLYPLIEEVYINFMIFREFRIPEITLTESGTAFALIFLVTPGLVLLSCAILLLKRKKIGYYYALAILSIGLLYVILEWIRIFILAVEYPYCLFKTLPVCERISFATQALAESFRFNIFLTLLLLIPFLLLLLDRKNFWKVAS